MGNSTDSQPEVEIVFAPPDRATASDLMRFLTDYGYRVQIHPTPLRASRESWRPKELPSRGHILLASFGFLAEVASTVALRPFLNELRLAQLPVIFVYEAALDDIEVPDVVASMRTAKHVAANFADLEESVVRIATIIGPPANTSVAASALWLMAKSINRWAEAPPPRRIDPNGFEPPVNKSAAAAGPDVFISYAREDAEKAQKIAEAIEACGWRVWWDRTLVAGVNFRAEIERQLEAAKCVVVLWSKQSIKANFVLDEAGHAIEREVLVQVLIEGVTPPFGFRQYHFADLTKWNGEADGAGFPVLKKGILRFVPPQ